MTTTQPTKVIRVACKGGTMMNWKDLHPFQGEIKDLEKTEYEQLKASVIEYGITAPFHAWPDKKKKHWCLDGHQRIRLFENMEKEGWKIPKLVPVDTVEAENVKRAREILLTHASTYGKLNKQGLYQFVLENQITPEWMTQHVHLPGVDNGAFFDEFFNNTAPDAGNLSGQGDNEAATTDMRSSSSQVRMVQLFFNGENHPEFLKKCEALGQKYKTDNITDTVMEAIRAAHRSAFPSK